MPRVGEFCAANVSRLLLTVAICVIAVISISYWLFYTPGKGSLVKQPDHSVQPVIPPPTQ